MRFLKLLAVLAVLSVFHTCCSCASNLFRENTLKEWGRFLSLGSGAEDGSSEAFRTAPSLAPSSSRPSSHAPSTSLSRLEQQSTSVGHQPPGRFLLPELQQLREQYGAAKQIADDRFSEENIFSTEVLETRWHKLEDRRSFTYIMNNEEQAIVLDYIVKRMLAQLPHARHRPELFSKMRFQPNRGQLPADFWEKANNIDVGVHNMNPSVEWTDLYRQQDRIFDLGALRFRMWKLEAKTAPFEWEEGEDIRTWLIVARPTDEAMAHFKQDVSKISSLKDQNEDTALVLKIAVGQLRIPKRLVPRKKLGIRTRPHPNLRLH